MSEPPQKPDDVNRLTQLTSASLHQLLEEHPGGMNDPAASLISVAERNELIDAISQIIPAGNVLKYIANSLLQSSKGDIGLTTGRSHVNSLYRSLSFMRDSITFMGPAAVLVGYNLLLQLTGHDIDTYIPDGTWQFYVEFGLREDTGRHQNETTAFQRLTSSRSHKPTDETQLTAWVLASNYIINHYERLLEMKWEENIRLRIIEETTGMTNIYRKWQALRTFAAPDLQTDLVDHRQQRFNQFCDYHLSQATKAQWNAYTKIWYDPNNQEERGRARRAYVRQMSIYRYLEPNEYNDERVPVDPASLGVAIIYGGNYYLLPVVETTDLEALTRLYATTQGVLKQKNPPQAQVDLSLTMAPRAVQQRLRGALGRDQRQDLEALRKAPIIINWDKASHRQPLTAIRAGKRGIGDHALTLFRTDASTVFDFSHIFFDGPWAMATAEMLTNEAMRFLAVLDRLPLQRVPRVRPPSPLNLKTDKGFATAFHRYAGNTYEVSAEVSRLIEPLQRMRQSLKQRTGLRLTINDILVLYRTIANHHHILSGDIKNKLAPLRANPETALLITNLEKSLTERRAQTPSLLIPIDASRHDPKERLFPSIFRSPLPDFRSEHNKLMEQHMLVSQASVFNRQNESVDAFIKQRESYLGYLKAFGEMMQHHRKIAVSGESMGTAAIRLIAGLSPGLQQAADSLSDQFAVVNENIKGEEVFSNVGRVSSNSSLTRFASAKDDNIRKVLVWGIMTDHQDRLIVTLRDFREPILALARAGHAPIAHQITNDFLNAYIDGVYRFAAEVEGIIQVSSKPR